LLDAVRALDGEFRFETFFSLSCQNCPDVVQALNIMAALNPNVSHVAIDGALFQDEVERRQVMAVPMVFLNGEPFGQGRMDLAQIMAKLDTSAVARAAEKIAAMDPFDVLVVGGGPAGAAAAIYAARKGIRTGVAAERFGGQVLDTMGIENFISVPHTEGPKLAAHLEQHVREYAVEVMNLQTATQLVPAATPGGLHEVKLASGASLKAKTVILSTGARWRQMGVPGEDEYRNKGVAYCPHCDGPLFKGKRTAVIGGGNSGVEAAIDLAGIVSHVTLIEFDSQLRADAVLQDKLRSLPNVTIITSALTTAVLGDGSKVTGLTYKDRTTEAEHTVELEGIFVQIGLVPNTEWLKDAVALSPRGEIEITASGATNVPGVFEHGRPCSHVLSQIGRVDLVERIIRGVVQIKIARTVLIQIDHRQLLRRDHRLHIRAAMRRIRSCHDPQRSQCGLNPIAQRRVGIGKIHPHAPDPARAKIAFHCQCVRLAGMGGGVSLPAKPAQFF
ncbi:MAG: hypothetical protein RIQ99_2170, partial [Pseudomonadota bacterium]